MKTEYFEMRVTDRFNFQEGRTVFVGKVSGHPGPIRSLVCELRVDKNSIGRITLEGEMLREAQGDRSGLRSVSTLDAIPELPKGDIVLLEATTEGNPLLPRVLEGRDI